MTPKEKAQELVDKFIDCMPPLANQTGKTIMDYAKKCAIISVDEILSLVEGKEFLATERVLNEVKTEINNL